MQDRRRQNEKEGAVQVVRLVAVVGREQTHLVGTKAQLALLKAHVLGSDGDLLVDMTEPNRGAATVAAARRRDHAELHVTEQQFQVLAELVEAPNPTRWTGPRFGSRKKSLARLRQLVDPVTNHPNGERTYRFIRHRVPPRWDAENQGPAWDAWVETEPDSTLYVAYPPERAPRLPERVFAGTRLLASVVGRRGAYGELRVEASRCSADSTYPAFIDCYIEVRNGGTKTAELREAEMWLFDANYKRKAVLPAFPWRLEGEVSPWDGAVISRSKMLVPPDDFHEVPADDSARAVAAPGPAELHPTFTLAIEAGSSRRGWLRFRNESCIRVAAKSANSAGQAKDAGVAMLAAVHLRGYEGAATFGLVPVLGAVDFDPQELRLRAAQAALAIEHDRPPTIDEIR